MEKSSPSRKSSELKDSQQKKLSENQYLKFTGLAFELCSIIGLGVWGGYSLDKYFGNHVPWLTVVFTFLATIIAFISLFRKISQQ